MEKPYLLFLGDVPDQLAAKTATGIADWRPEWCVGQSRLPGCQADTGLPDLSIEEAWKLGAKTLVIGVVNSGGVMPDNWTSSIVEAIELGMDVASGLHSMLEDFPAIAKAAEANNVVLHNVRRSPQGFRTGRGEPRSGKRLLTVGTDCSVGKKYTALALERDMRKSGLKADFCATGQTGVFIAERGVAIDAVIADFISGAVEWLSPENDVDHWDVIEGQGSLFHAAFAGVSLGLLHGAQPDALVLCHEPTRTHMRGLAHAPLPDIQDCLETYVQLARLTNQNCRFVGIAVNSSNLEPARVGPYLESLEDKFGLPCVDPIAGDTVAIVKRLND